MKKILVATDMSARSDRALQRAFALAHERQAEVEVVHVVDNDRPQEIVDHLEKSARTTIAELISAMARSREMRVSTTIIRGQDYVEILKRSEVVEADLIVIGIHRHSILDLFRGTTAERIIRFGRRPVLMVRDAVATAYGRVLVGVDMSVHSLHALELAAELVPRGEFQIVHATHAPFKAFIGKETIKQIVDGEQKAFAEMMAKEIQALTSRLGASTPRCEIVAVEGSVLTVLRKQIETFKPDLIAIGTHGRTGIAHAILGSVAEELLAEAPADVLTVKA